MAIIKRQAASGLSSWTVSELGSFYEEHRSQFVLHANRILKDPSRAEEVVQDALVRFMLAAPELNSVEHALAYLHKTIENICLDIFRAEGRRPQLVVLDDATSDLESSWQHNSKDHADVIAEADDAAIIRQALAMLSPAERAALVMWEMEGRSTKEIAKELGIKEASVRHTVSRARASLRKVLSEWIIDEDRGLTAIDLLSTTYKKASEVAKKSSRVALSLILLVFAYLGFVNASDSPTKVSIVSSSETATSATSESTSKTVQSKLLTNEVNASSSVKSNIPTAVNAKASPLTFAGLDKAGVPTGFTITDGTGSLGSLFFVGRDTALSESGLTLSSIAKTSKGAANLLLNQTLVQDSSGISYDAMVSFGRAGAWIPTFTKVISVESERLVSGNYMVTAVVQVKSEVETTIVIPAVADGRDLDVPPSRVVTRILLNPAKTQVLAQAVQVVEKVTK